MARGLKRVHFTKISGPTVNHCGSNSRNTTFDILDVTCGHCKRSHMYRLMKKTLQRDFLDLREVAINHDCDLIETRHSYNLVGDKNEVFFSLSEIETYFKKEGWL